MIQNPNQTDYPHLEQFVDWLYEHVEELPGDVEILKARVQHWTPSERTEQMRKDVAAIAAAEKG